ncbi:MAG: thioredoxin family protein [Cellvibrionales bacterium]|nr:thioredoxin family protein [Cellvibrionales bacterium]
MLLETPKVNTGWKAPEFSLNTPEGIAVSLKETITDKGLLIAFICNHCPYVQAIAERLSKDTKTLNALGVPTLAIMANDYQNYPDDAPDKMLEFAQHYGFEFPYLIDEDQSIAKAFGAVCTPDFFGINGNGELQYRGRLDDAKMERSKERVPELLNAMKQIAETGIAPVDQYPSIGCSIKWKD